jgi:hypothetical protein
MPGPAKGLCCLSEDALDAARRCKTLRLFLRRMSSKEPNNAWHFAYREPMELPPTLVGMLRLDRQRNSNQRTLV